MYRIAPPAVYAHESAMSDPRYRARVERVVAALERPLEVIPFTDADIPALIREKGILKQRVPMNTLPEVRDPILLFNTFRFAPQDEIKRSAEALSRDAGVKGDIALDFVGSRAFQWFDSNLDTDEHKHDKVCRPCWRIHLQSGCVHRCLYCGFGGILFAMVNVEEYCGHLGELIRRHPWQKTYLLDDDADPPCLEPELGTLSYLIEYFGTLKDRYLIIHTKTWNTEWMRGLRHNGNTIIVWSISGPTQSRLIEPKTGSTEERIEAARAAQDAGYQIRYKFKPIVPVRRWREDAEYAVERVFARTKPDVISLCCWMWNDVDEMKKRLPTQLLDPAFLKAAEESKAEMAGTRARPFPHWARKEIYEHYLAQIRRHNRDIPVSLSTENFRMWSDMQEKLGYNATNYVCGCGPQSVPGLRKLPCHPFKVAVPDASDIPGVTGLPHLGR